MGVGKSNKIELPKLLHGEGTMSWMPDGETIIYKKMINKKRITAYGKTVKEVLKDMKEKEKKAYNKQAEEKKDRELNKKKLENMILKEDITNWFYLYKKSVLKAKSFDTQEYIITKHILAYDIAKMKIVDITSDDIQKHLNKIIEADYSFSVVKKTYEALNQYFRYRFAKKPADNPMLIMNAPTESGVNKPVKKIEIFDDKDIIQLRQVATLTHRNGKPVYRLGWGIILILYTGVRIGEAVGLRWSDINIELNKIYVKETASRVIDREAEPREDGNRTWKTLYTSTKTPLGVRIVELTDNTKKAIIELKKLQAPKSENDFVFATGNRKAESPRNLRRTLNKIQKRAGTKLQNSGHHVLRHIFCSLLVRRRVDKKVIAEIMGQNDTDMIEKVYQHVTMTEKIDAIEKINSIINLAL